MSETYGPEGWKTVRAAIREGWGPTLRFTVILTAPTVVMIGLMIVR